MADAEVRAASDSKKCHLLELPSELRNRIWEGAAREDNIIRLNLRKGPCTPEWVFAGQQIFREAVPPGPPSTASPPSFKKSKTWAT
ncbi:hypothetical protein M409DRAFT_20429 [Zasmidium cellare ATCC 36951]|uniref:Uncharacterized protein n=1 Tax=Zasmidium cellare ATCC 36951 TaxID=1080233 RepID=A0A6A6CUP0_ZASCE|nr:uncharacterized protein M409DRAFT_20429 [Zasmidium cellare ATCC 36951]KAF2169206.1 hypothetical protein M409DRAFT_20429 [Zasmidium cellare ATCC 36951]